MTNFLKSFRNNLITTNYYLDFQIFYYSKELYGFDLYKENNMISKPNPSP